MTYRPIFNKNRSAGRAFRKCTFWQTILLEVHLFWKSPSSHKHLPVEKPTLIVMEILSTVDGLFKGPIADEAKFVLKHGRNV
jgi:hypothetical protein